MPQPLIDADDIWGDDGDDDSGRHQENASAELDREWRARREEFWNSGYREGVEAGKHDTVQAGFDQGAVFNLQKIFYRHRLSDEKPFHFQNSTGYSLGSEVGYEWGVLRGAALTLQSAARVKGGGLLPTDKGSAAELLSRLAPGQVQKELGMKLLQDSDDSPSGEAAKKGVVGEGPMEKTQREAQAALEAAGFTLETAHDSFDLNT